ncbi:MAG: metallophosphoesterase [Anderseniella sp.]
MNRRGFLKWLGGLLAAGTAMSAYAFAIEPGLRLRIQKYAFTPPRWTPGLKLRIACIADPHLGEPHMPLSRLQRIVETTNNLKPDLILLLGDYAAGHRFVTRPIDVTDTAQTCAGLSAPLGRFAIMGNHDWWDDLSAQKNKSGPIKGEMAFEAAGIPVLENKAIRLEQNGLPFWISGTSSIVALKTERPGRYDSKADLEATLAHITDEAPVIHMAHEPDMFINIPERISLTLSGHTHGGQVRLFGWSPVVPSAFGNRYAYGHIIEDGRHLVVSGGLGTSIMPVRFGIPPEIVMLELG